jgi:hypothetical protein
MVKHVSARRCLLRRGRCAAPAVRGRLARLDGLQVRPAAQRAQRVERGAQRRRGGAAERRKRRRRARGRQAAGARRHAARPCARYRSHTRRGAESATSAARERVAPAQKALLLVRFAAPPSRDVGAAGG